MSVLVRGLTEHRAPSVRRTPLLVNGRPAHLLSWLLALDATVTAAMSLAFPSLLSGTEVGKGNLRGTALVVLAVGIPLLIVGMLRASSGSARALVIWLGAAGYLTYQAVLFCFATPMNKLFLLSVAWLGLGIWTLIVLLRRVDVSAFSTRVDGRMPVRLVAGAAAAVALLNGAVWLGRIVPGVFTDHPGSVLRGSGLLTSPIWVQDLAFWLPGCLLAAVWMWQRRDAGTLLVGGFLSFYVIECISIASDQWWGWRADAHQPDWASLSMVPAFLILGAITLIPLASCLRHVRDGAREPRKRIAPMFP